MTNFVSLTSKEFHQRRKWLADGGFYQKHNNSWNFVNLPHESLLRIHKQINAPIPFRRQKEYESIDGRLYVDYNGTVVNNESNRLWAKANRRDLSTMIKQTKFTESALFDEFPDKN